MRESQFSLKRRALQLPLRAALAGTFAALVFTSAVNAQAYGWWPQFTGQDAEASLTIKYVYAGVAGNRFSIKISPWPADNFACSVNYNEVTIDSNNPKFKQLWAQLTTAHALGQRVNVYLYGCTGGGNQGLPLIADVVVRN